MAAFAAPLLWPTAVEAAKAAAAIVGGAISVVAVDKAVEAIDEALAKREQERPGTSDRTVDDTCVVNCAQKKCPPCVPPVGSIRVKRIDRVPPGRPHKPCPGDHAHLVKRNQAPYPDCSCHWNELKPVVCLEPGELPPYPMI